jgi:hypothetical protein
MGSPLSETRGKSALTPFTMIRMPLCLLKHDTHHRAGGKGCHADRAVPGILVKPQTGVFSLRAARAPSRGAWREQKPPAPLPAMPGESAEKPKRAASKVSYAESSGDDEDSEQLGPTGSGAPRGGKNKDSSDDDKVK